MLKIFDLSAKQFLREFLNKKQAKVLTLSPDKQKEQMDYFLPAVELFNGLPSNGLKVLSIFGF